MHVFHQALNGFFSSVQFCLVYINSSPHGDNWFSNCLGNGDPTASAGPVTVLSSRPGPSVFVYCDLCFFSHLLCTHHCLVFLSFFPAPRQRVLYLTGKWRPHGSSRSCDCPCLPVLDLVRAFAVPCSFFVGPSFLPVTFVLFNDTAQCFFPSCSLCLAPL